MMTLHLYELSEGIKTLLDYIEEHGEDPDSWAAALDELTGDFQHKAINIAKLCRTWEAEEEVYKTEIARLQAHAKAAAGRQSWAKQYLKAQMEEAGIEHVKGDVVDIRLQSSPPSVEVGEFSDVAPEYVRATLRLPYEKVPEGYGDYVTDVSVDKRAILDAFKADGAVPFGARLVQSRHVRIR